MDLERVARLSRRLRARGDTATLKQLAEVAERHVATDLTYGRLNEDRRSRFERATRWALVLAELDRDRGWQALCGLSWRLMRSIKEADTKANDRLLSDCVGCLGKVLAKRLELGDDRAMAEFETNIASITPWFWSADVERCRALTVRPDWGGRVAKAMFLGPRATLNLAYLARLEKVDLLQNLLGSDLLRFPAARTSLCEALDDKTVVGTCWSDKFGYFFADLAATGRGYGSDSGLLLPSDPRDPEPEVRSELRACDLVAFDLSLFRGAPLFRPYWSPADRDDAIREMAAFVRRTGGALVERRPPAHPYGHEDCLWKQPPFPKF